MDYATKEIAVNKALIFMCVLALLGAMSGCSDECSSYSDFSCKEIDQANYNIYFYHPNESEIYLGQAKGISQCGAMALNFAHSKDLSRNNDWGYICCMIAKGSQCYEKHR